MLCLPVRNRYFCIHKRLTMDLKKLRDIRRMRKISIKDLSKTTGINRDRISLIERGKVNPSFNTVETIAKAIGAEIILSI